MRLTISCQNAHDYLQKVDKMISVIHNNIVVRAEQEEYFGISYQVEA